AVERGHDDQIPEAADRALALSMAAQPVAEADICIGGSCAAALDCEDAARDAQLVGERQMPVHGERRPEVKTEWQSVGAEDRAAATLVVHGHAQALLPTHQMRCAELLQKSDVCRRAAHGDVLAVVYG